MQVIGLHIDFFLMRRSPVRARRHLERRLLRLLVLYRCNLTELPQETGNNVVVHSLGEGALLSL